ncbi:hypothetical protein ACFLZN_01695 [Nanoarchaeota archaeon]
MDDDPELDVVVSAHHTPYFPGMISVFDIGGNLKRRYWNAGRTYEMVLHDITGDEIKEIFVAGVNNDAGSVPVLFCLDGQMMMGESPPRRGKFKKGREIWYKGLSRDKTEARKLRLVDGVLICTDHKNVVYRINPRNGTRVD